MDIMQVLQDICKNPEAHEKGTNMIHLTLTLYATLPFWVLIFATANYLL